jgi:hypothetical protein
MNGKGCIHRNHERKLEGFCNVVGRLEFSMLTIEIFKQLEREKQTSYQ